MTIAAGIQDSAGTIGTVRGLTVTFPGNRPRLWSRRSTIAAVKDIDLDMVEGQTLGLVGESGSGKSTTGRALLRLNRPDAGTMEVAGFAVHEMGRRVPLAYRRAVQAVFQDPLGSLDPLMEVGQILAEPLQIHQPRLTASDRRARVRGLLEDVGLSPSHIARYTYELSGGQRQRVAIAKALAAEPDVVVLDEPVSALDVSVQSQIINLLEQVQAERGLTYLFVAHDLSVVRHTSDQVAVMYRGRIVEKGPADRVCGSPVHPYTQALFQAVPNPVPGARRRAPQVSQAPRSQGEADSQAVDEGCPYYATCPLRMDRCAVEFPAFTPVAAGGEVACHAISGKPDRESTPLPR